MNVYIIYIKKKNISSCTRIFKAIQLISPPGPYNNIILYIHILFSVAGVRPRASRACLTARDKKSSSDFSHSFACSLDSSPRCGLCANQATCDRRLRRDEGSVYRIYIFFFSFTLFFLSS